MVIWSILRLICIIYGHLVYLTANWCNLWSFGIFCGHLLYFSRFGMLFQEKSGNTEKQHLEK
jgi:hypothetical protein